MPHINLAEDLPGIRSLFAFRQDTAKILCDLANALLYEPSTLSQADRELIATYVSSLNACTYCQASHAAIAAAHLHGNEDLVAEVRRDPEAAPISEKLKALLAIAGQVQKGGKSVRAEHIERARAAGATDREIHDAVLIAAAFCMYNRYVDGLATWAPDDADGYRQRGEAIARHGYQYVPAVSAAAARPSTGS